MNELSTGWLLLSSWDLLPLPASWLPCAEPQDLDIPGRCGLIVRRGPRGWAGIYARDSVRCVREGAHSLGEFGSPHTSLSWGWDPSKRLRPEPAPTGLLSRSKPPNVFKSPRQQEPRGTALSAFPPGGKKPTLLRNPFAGSLKFEV